MHTAWAGSAAPLPPRRPAAWRWANQSPIGRQGPIGKPPQQGPQTEAKAQRQERDHPARGGVDDVNTPVHKNLINRIAPKRNIKGIAILPNTRFNGAVGGHWKDYPGSRDYPDRGRCDPCSMAAVFDHAEAEAGWG